MSENTILVSSYLKTSKENFSLDELPIHAAPGLHDRIFEEIKKILPRDASILELGSGSGAFSRRLMLASYEITAVDYSEENFRLHDTIHFIKMDLNEKFAKKLNQTYDCIVAIELIEHLENPRNFFRECKKLLKPNGFLIFTTPNIDSPISKYLFLRRSCFNHFSDFDYHSSGHITPLSQWYIKNLISENKFKPKHQLSFGKTYLGKNFIFVILKKILIFFLKRISKTPDSLNGNLLIYVLEK